MGWRFVTSCSQYVPSTDALREGDSESFVAIGPQTIEVPGASLQELACERHEEQHFYIVLLLGSDMFCLILETIDELLLGTTEDLRPLVLEKALAGSTALDVECGTRGEMLNKYAIN